MNLVHCIISHHRGMSVSLCISLHFPELLLNFAKPNLKEESSVIGHGCNLSQSQPSISNFQFPKSNFFQELHKLPHDKWWEKNGFALILWLKKGGGLIREGVLYAGYYGQAHSKVHTMLDQPKEEMKEEQNENVPRWSQLSPDPLGLKVQG